MKRKKYQSGGNIKLKKKKSKLDLDYLEKGFDKAIDSNLEQASSNLERAENKFYSKKNKSIVGSIIKAVPNAYAGLANVAGSIIPEIGKSAVRGVRNVITDVKNIGTGKGRSTKFGRDKKQKGGTGVKLAPGSDKVYNTTDDLDVTNPDYRKAEKAAKTSGKTSFTFNGKTYKVKKKLVHVSKRNSDGTISVEKQMMKKGGCKKCGGMYQEGGFLLPPIEEL